MKDLVFVIVEDINNFDTDRFCALNQGKRNVFYVTNSNTQTRMIPHYTFINNVSSSHDINFDINRGDKSLICKVFEYLIHNHKTEYDNVYVINENISDDRLYSLQSTMDANVCYSDFLYNSWFKQFERIKIDDNNSWSDWKYGGEFFASHDLCAAGCDFFRVSRTFIQCLKLFIKDNSTCPPVEIFIPSICKSYGLIINQMKLSFQKDDHAPVDFRPVHDSVVFTSCGDRTECNVLWTNGNRQYDIVAVYYGDNEENYNRFKQSFDHVIRRKGSKFQNFFHMFRNTNILKSYKYLFVLDDDIIMDTSKINQMFDFSKNHDEITVCQPCFTKDSKISHGVTKQHNTRFRYTNFVEVNTPLFKKHGVETLNKYYDESLIGWGVDWLYLWAINNKQPPGAACRHFAVNDQVCCVNPKEKNKPGGTRELMILKHAASRRKTWEQYMRKIGLRKTWKGRTLKNA